MEKIDFFDPPSKKMFIYIYIPGTYTITGSNGLAPRSKYGNIDKNELGFKYTIKFKLR